MCIVANVRQGQGEPNGDEPLASLSVSNQKQAINLLDSGCAIERQLFHPTWVRSDKGRGQIHFLGSGPNNLTTVPYPKEGYASSRD